VRVCVIGSVDDLADVERLLAGLPEDAYGQVFIAASDTAGRTLDGPARVCVTWLGDDPVTTPDRLLAAFSAWAAEWVAGEPSSAQPTLWIGRNAGSGIVEELAYLPDLTIAAIPCAASPAEPGPAADPHQVSTYRDPAVVNEG
jgi:hypothetical protein